MDFKDLKSIVHSVPEDPEVNKNIWIGVFSIFGFLFFLLMWSIFATLDSAVVAEGHFIVEGSRKTIQHLEGGIIKSLYVIEGQIVKQGDPIITLDDVQAKAKLLLIKGQIYEYQSSQARIMAELSNQMSIHFPEDLLVEAKKNKKVNIIIEGQKQLLIANNNSYDGQVKILKQRIAQFEKQIESYQAQVNSKSTQLDLINEELVAVAYLESKKLIDKPRLLALRREAARLMGDRDENMGLIARARQGIGETQTQIYELNEERRKELLKQLREDEKNLAELLQQMYAAQDTYNRLIIRAPQNGIVLDLKTHTIGGVITPGQAICEIVPIKTNNLLEVRIKPMDIDVVKSGLPVKIRLTAYKQRNTPTFKGEVMHVDPDSIYDTKTNELYYKAYVNFLPLEKDELIKYKIFPGMPAQALIITDHMSPLNYILSPIKESFNRAFRDN